MKNNTQYLDISTSTIVKTLLLIAAAYLIFVLRDVLVLLTISFIISSGISIGAKYLNKNLNLSYYVSATIVVVVISGLIAILFSIFIPTLLSEYAALVNNFPELIKQFDVFIASIVNQPFESIQTLIPENSNIIGVVRTVAYGFFFTTENILARGIDVIFLITATLILAYQPRRFDDLVVVFFPKNLHRKVRYGIKKARQKVGSWLLGQLILTLIVGASSYAVFIILGVPYSLLLAIISGVLNVIPMLGPVLAIIPAVIFALFNSLQTALGVIIFYTVLQQFDGIILTPLVMRKVTGINTIVIIFSVLIGVAFAGFLGAIIAVPIVSIVSIFLSDLTYTTQKEG